MNFAISNGMNMLAWQFVRRFLRIWLPLILVLIAVLWLLYRTDVNALQALTQTDEKHAIQLASQSIAAELGMLRGDALYLAEEASLHRWLDSGDPAARAHLSADLLAFARHRGLYDQIRFIDEHGREIVRVNWNNGQPREAPAAELQDKSGRYYVEKTLALDEGELYISPFDLNIENNVIEQPIKPMIRLGTPVFDHEGRKRGLIMLNYLGQRLLDHLLDIRSQNDSGLWLLNEEGYWLLGPSPEMEWGFMYPERKTRRFDIEYGDAWRSMLAESKSQQLMGEEGLFTYVRIEPAASLASAMGERWILVTFVPAAMFSAKMAGHSHGLLIAFVILALVLAIVSGVITQKDMLRRQGEDKVRESESRFRSLLDSAPDAIVIVDNNGCINLINSQTENWFGYSRDELLGQPIERLVPERFRKQHINDREGYVSRPLARPMGTETVLYGLRKDGSEFPVEISLSPLQTKYGLLVTSIVRDISARKEAEQAQHQVEARYQELINNLPIGVYRNTPGNNGTFLEVNPTMVEMFEAKSNEELLAHCVSDLYCTPADRQSFNDKIMRRGRVTAEELRLKTLGGREFDAAITAVMKTDAAGNVYFDGIVEDISERKKSERQIQQLNDSLRARSKDLETINQELEAFSYSVSHDLRTPLRAMDGFSSKLLQDYADILDDKGRDRLNRVRAAAQRMAALIDDLLKLSRVSRTEIKLESVDLTKLANDIMGELGEGDPQRQVQFFVEPELVAQGDARLLQLVMANLLENAWKFTGQRDVARIEMGGRDESGEVTYFVRDNGAGFDMSYAEKLFGAFQRLHDSNEFPGTGIGLATVQRVIHKHGGRIWADSAVDQGATFYFSLS
jgi:PAS domain S-box-containing protein